MTPAARMVQSIMAYFLGLSLDYPSFDERSLLGICSTEERQRHLETGAYEPVEEAGSASELVEKHEPKKQGRRAGGRGR